MKAIPQVAPEVFSRLIQKIDADSFEEREMACKGLLQFGKMSLPSLQKALRDGLSVEATRRAPRSPGENHRGAIMPSRSSGDSCHRSP